MEKTGSRRSPTMESMLMPARGGHGPSAGPTTTDGPMDNEDFAERQGGLPRVGGISSEAQTVVRPSTLLVDEPLSLSPFPPKNQKPIDHHHHHRQN